MHSGFTPAVAVKPDPVARQRVSASAHIGSKCRQPDGLVPERCVSAIAALDQQGSARIRLPRVSAGPLQAVLLNTAGGLTGDDEIHWSGMAGEGSHLRISTAACEKLYRTHGPAAVQKTSLEVGKGARIDWLPQETIVFDGSALKRTLHADVAADATILLVESIVLGRKAMQETVTHLDLHDRWRIHRDGQLLHAEDMRLQLMSAADARQQSMLHQFGAISTVLLVSPKPKESLERLLSQLQDRIPPSTLTFSAAASIMEHRLIVRLLADSSLTLRKFLIPCIEHLNEGLSIPQVWNV